MTAIGGKSVAMGTHIDGAELAIAYRAIAFCEISGGANVARWLSQFLASLEWPGRSEPTASELRLQTLTQSLDAMERAYLRINREAEHESAAPAAVSL